MKNYTGARYVPKFADNDWTAGTAYEALTVVRYLNSYYTSKIPVPSSIGNPASNPTYWALTGNYNGQVEGYRKEVEGYKQDAEDAINEVGDKLTAEINTRKEETTAINGKLYFIISEDEGSDITDELNEKIAKGSVMIDGKNYNINSPINITGNVGNHNIIGNGSHLTYTGSESDNYMFLLEYDDHNDYSDTCLFSNFTLSCEGKINGLGVKNGRCVNILNVNVYNPKSVGFKTLKNCEVEYDSCYVAEQAFDTSKGSIFTNKITAFDSHEATDTIYTNCTCLFAYVGMHLGSADIVTNSHMLGLTNTDNNEVYDGDTKAYWIDGNDVQMTNCYADEFANGIYSNAEISRLNITGFYFILYTNQSTTIMKNVINIWEVPDGENKHWNHSISISKIIFAPNRTDVRGFYFPKGHTLWLPAVQNWQIDFNLDPYTLSYDSLIADDISRYPWFNKGKIEEMAPCVGNGGYIIFGQIDTNTDFEDTNAWFGFNCSSPFLKYTGAQILVYSSGSSASYQTRGEYIARYGDDTSNYIDIEVAIITYQNKDFIAIKGGAKTGSIGATELWGVGVKMIAPGRLTVDGSNVILKSTLFTISPKADKA